jgi:hypothetical protein
VELRKGERFLCSSFATTINVLEGLLAHERATVARPNRSRLAGMVRHASSNEHCSGDITGGIFDPWLWFLSNPLAL